MDTASDPLTVLRVLVEGLELMSDSGFWLTSLTGIPGVPRISPFDLAYLNEEKQVVQCIELLPGTEFPPFERLVVSALVMPLHTFSSTQTRAGDRLLVCGEEEMMQPPGAHLPKERRFPFSRKRIRCETVSSTNGDS